MRKFCFFVVSIGFVVLIAACLPLRHAGPAFIPPSTRLALLSGSSAVSPASTFNPSSDVTRVRSQAHKESSISPREGVPIPLEFEANRGQAPAQFSFVAHGPDYSLGLAP